MLLANKVALITGAQKGIGRAIALTFAREGADVAVNYLDDRASIDAVVSEVAALGRKAVPIKADVGRVAAAQDLVETAVSAFGRLDIMVNNAGIFPRASFLDLTEAMWDATHAVNLKGTCFGSQAAARHMVAAGTRGVIITIASRAASGAVDGTHYSATKGGVISLTRSMALELAPYGIRVNGIAPGIVDTDQPRDGHTEAGLQEIAAASLAGRLGQPAEIAAVATFLASDMSSYMTGEVVNVNGGSYMA